MTTTRPPAPSAGLLLRLVAAAAAVVVSAWCAFGLAAAAVMTCFGGCSSTDRAFGWLVGSCAAAVLACGPLAAGRLLGGRAWSWLAGVVLTVGVAGSGYVMLAGS